MNLSANMLPLRYYSPLLFRPTVSTTLRLTPPYLYYSTITLQQYQTHFLGLQHCSHAPVVKVVLQ
jgi:hypothetical protein